MTIEWFDPKKKLPDDKQECLLMPVDRGGMCTVGVFGPIRWNQKERVWLDIFRSPEAGTMINPDQVGCWTLWDPIKPMDDEDD